MTTRKLKAVAPRLEALIAQDRDLIKSLVKEALDQILQAEMSECVGAEPGERTELRTGYRAGYYSRGSITRVGKIAAVRVAGSIHGTYEGTSSSLDHFVSVLQQ